MRLESELTGTKLELFSGRLIVIKRTERLFIVVDNEKVCAETKAYKKIPQILSFTDEQGNDNMKQVIEANYRQVKADVVLIVESEMERIKNDPDLQHLILQDG